MVSLVVATFNRVTELQRLLKSLDAQTYKKFEVIVVDQNPDDRVVAVLREHQQLTIVHLRCTLGVSRARNAGLRVAKGEVIAFPDDDCWYPDDLLATVTAWLDANPKFGGIFTATRNQDDRLQAPKFPPRRGPCTRTSVLRCAVIVGAFFRMSAVEAIGLFREDIGPGTSSPYQSGEDIDYLIRPLDYGMQLFYESAFFVYHPDLNTRERLRRIIFPYSVGVGYILRLHGYPWWVLAEVAGRSLGGVAVHLAKADFEGAYLYSLRAAGQLRGYLSRPHDSLKPAGASSGAGGDK
jgi:glycosyltransferase involved in cell wall biosynthesis